MGCKLGIDPRQVENRSDLANQVIVGNGLFKTKRVKQPTLVVIEPPHHRPTPPRIVSERRNHCSREPSTTFATKSAKSGHMQRSNRVVIRSPRRRGEQRERDGEAESLGGLRSRRSVSRSPTVVLDGHGGKQLAIGHAFSHRCW